MSDIITVRDIGMVTTEILMIRNQVNQVALNGAIEIGRRLVEAKDMLPHGEWGRWLKDEVDFSQRTANNFMQLFNEYGSEQITLFGAVAKSQTIANLTYTKALKLLAIPAEEREEFAEEVHADELSARQLDEAIRERNAAREEAEDLQLRIGELEILLEDANRDLDSADEDIRAAREEEQRRAEQAISDAEQVAAAAKSRAEVAERQAEDLRKKLATAESAAQKASAALKCAQENPEIPEATLEKIRKDAAGDAAQKVAAEYAKVQADLEASEAAAKEAREQAERAEAQLAAAKKQLMLANPDAAVFASVFSSVQEEWNRLHGVWLKIQTADPALAVKLSAAVKAQLDKWSREEW